MPCSSTRSPENGSAAGAIFRRRVPRSRKRFTVRRVLGAADLWVSEFILTYDGVPSYTVSIMEFQDGRVARETQYFGDPFAPGPSRAQWVEQIH